MSGISIKKLLVGLLIVAILLNVLVGALLVSDIEIFKAPKISADLDFVGYNSSAFKLQTNLTIENPNPFTISLENLQVTSTTLDGLLISTISLEDTLISSGTTHTLESLNDLRFPNIELVPLSHQITGIVSVSFAGIIQKSIHIDLTVGTDFGSLLDNISAPIISFDTNLTEINQDGIAYSGIIHIQNPNSFGITLSEFNLEITDDSQHTVGHVNLEDVTLDANGTTETCISGNLDFSALNSESLIFSLTGQSGILMGGINQSISFATQISLHIPEIESILDLEEDLEVTISVDFRFQLLGLNNKIGFSIYNPTTLPLILEDLTCTIYRVDGESLSYIADEALSSCQVDPDETVNISTDIFIYYLDFIRCGNGRLLPDSVKLTIHGSIGIADVDQRLPFSVSGLFDLNLLE